MVYNMLLWIALKELKFINFYESILILSCKKSVVGRQKYRFQCLKKIRKNHVHDTFLIKSSTQIYRLSSILSACRIKRKLLMVANERTLKNF